MRKTINIDVLDLEETDTICGYRVKDLLLAAEVMQKEGVDAKDLKNLSTSIEFAYKTVRNDLERVLHSFSFNEDTK